MPPRSISAYPCGFTCPTALPPLQHDDYYEAPKKSYGYKEEKKDDYYQAPKKDSYKKEEKV
jgi:hypothetical protein